MGLSVWSDLPGAQHRRRDHHAGGEHRGDGRASGRNQPTRLGGCHWSASAGRRGLAQLAQLKVPDNIVRVLLPPYAPELNPVENVWEFLRANFLSLCVWDTYEA